MRYLDITEFRTLGLLTLTVLLFIATGVVSAQSWTGGKVVHVASGDTFTAKLDNGKQVRIKLAGVKSPHWNHPYAARSKQALARMIFNRRVRILKYRSISNLIVGHVYLGKRDINAEMIGEGHARQQQSEFIGNNFNWLENKARMNRRGLWKYKNLPYSR